MGRGKRGCAFSSYSSLNYRIISAVDAPLYLKGAFKGWKVNGKYIFLLAIYHFIVILTRMKDSVSRAAGVLFTRALLGIIFLMQGFGKVFVFTVPRVFDMFFKDFKTTFLPNWLIWATAYYTSYVELICGFLLIVGLFRNYCMYLLAIDLAVVSFGHGLLEPIWDLSHVMPRTILLLVLFFVPQEWDRWNADRILQSGKLRGDG
jgi:putative oxidoreductase